MVTITEERPPATAKGERIVRRPNTQGEREAFARRLTSAADGHPHCPPLNHGRLTWVQEELRKRYNLETTVESIRKWFAGETKPHADKIDRLAELFTVDVGWLAIGHDSSMTPRERKAHGRAVDGAVNVVAGLIQMDGGTPAFPDKEGSVDLHAIIKGAKYDFNVALCDDEGRFSVTADYESMIVLGLVRNGFSMRIFELDGEMIQSSGKRRGSVIEVTPNQETLREILSFKERI